MTYDISIHFKTSFKILVQIISNTIKIENLFLLRKKQKIVNSRVLLWKLYLNLLNSVTNALR